MKGETRKGCSDGECFKGKTLIWKFFTLSKKKKEEFDETVRDAISFHARHVCAVCRSRFSGGDKFRCRTVRTNGRSAENARVRRGNRCCGLPSAEVPIHPTV